MQGAFEYVPLIPLPLKFGTHVPNIMCIEMVQKLKIPQFKIFVPKAVKV
jgi:hypothetical protein